MKKELKKYNTNSTNIMINISKELESYNQIEEETKKLVESLNNYEFRNIQNNK